MPLHTSLSDRSRLRLKKKKEKEKDWAAVSNLFGTRDPFHGRQFFHGLGGGEEMVSGEFKGITFIVPYVFIIIINILYNKTYHAL